MSTYNVHAAKTHLSQLLQRALDGEEVVIAKAGRPLVRLVPVESAPARRSAGLWRDQFELPSDFDAPLPDLEAEIYG
jgi:prevent-host-death family protein